MQRSLLKPIASGISEKLADPFSANTGLHCFAFNSQNLALDVNDL
jgi:hypothetical protein